MLQFNFAGKRSEHAMSDQTGYNRIRWWIEYEEPIDQANKYLQAWPRILCSCLLVYIIIFITDAPLPITAATIRVLNKWANCETTTYPHTHTERNGWYKILFTYIWWSINCGYTIYLCQTIEMDLTKSNDIKCDTRNDYNENQLAARNIDAFVVCYQWFWMTNCHQATNLFNW